MVGVMLASVRWGFRIITVTTTDIVDMMPSEHSSDDIKWDQNISKPIRDTINANTLLI